MHHASEYLKLQISSRTLLHTGVFEILVIKFSFAPNFKHCKFILKVLLRYRILESKHIFVSIEFHAGILCCVSRLESQISYFVRSSLEDNSW